MKMLRSLCCCLKLSNAFHWEKLGFFVPSLGSTNIVLLSSTRATIYLFICTFFFFYFVLFVRCHVYTSTLTNPTTCFGF